MVPHIKRSLTRRHRQPWCSYFRQACSRLLLRGWVQRRSSWRFFWAPSSHGTSWWRRVAPSWCGAWSAGETSDEPEKRIPHTPPSDPCLPDIV